MKHRLIDLLACPRCGQKRPRLTCEAEETEKREFKIKFSAAACKEWCAFKQKKVQMGRRYPCRECFSAEIIRGTLTCPRCKESFPILRGIPRMLTGELREEAKTGDWEKKKLKETMDSFGYQWQEYGEMYEKYRDYFLDFMHPFKPGFFKGKLVLDAGCGFGRFCHFAHEFGAEVVGLDLSGAVETAYKNNRGNPLVHIIQGNIYELPLRKQFDLIYCLGVIQHLPKKEEGFRALARLRNKNTTLFVWVYGKRYDIYRLIDIMRPVTTRMPHKLLSAFCYLPATLQVLLFNVPYWILKRIPPLKETVTKIPYHRYAEYPFRHNVADWFDRLSVPLTAYFSREDLEKWFKNADIKDFTIIPRGYGWRAWAPKDAPGKSRDNLA